MGKSELRFAFLSLGVLFVCGLIMALRLAAQRVISTESIGLEIFSYLFVTSEPPLLIAALVFLAGVFFWTWRRLPVRSDKASNLDARRRWFIGGLALAVFLYTAVGNRVIYHGYPLCMDEYLVCWAGPVLRSGQVAPPVPPTFLPYIRALTPIFVMYNDQTHVWNSAYLPVHALLYGLFDVVGAGALLNPLMAALSVLLVAAVARRLWPDEPGAPTLAALLLATSTQVLAMGMSFYTMPSHLCLNLLWLLLYLRADRGSTLALPWLGVAALGLHYPFMHALFVLPFLVRILRTRRALVTLYVAAVYLLGCIFWFWWMKTFRPFASDVPEASRSLFADSGLFGWPRSRHVAWQFMALVKLFNWQNLAVGLLVVAARWHLARQRAVMRDLAWSVALSFGFYFFLNGNNGHGWGNRYSHGALGNLVLLAVGGALLLRAMWGTVIVRRLILATTLFALCVQLPLRAYQVEQFVRPFARASAYIEQLPADVVLINPTDAWYAQDLVRNDPFLAQRPLVMRVNQLSAEQRADLERHFSVRVVTAAELRALGLFKPAWNEPPVPEVPGGKEPAKESPEGAGHLAGPKHW